MKNKYAVGDTVYEVFLYKVRRAVITSVGRIRLDDPSRSRVYVYTVECEDHSMSPRYYESDFGVVLFTDPDSARARLEENLRYRSILGGREQYDMSGDEKKREESAAFYISPGAVRA